MTAKLKMCKLPNKTSKKQTKEKVKKLIMCTLGIVFSAAAKAE